MCVFQKYECKSPETYEYLLTCVLAHLGILTHFYYPPPKVEGYRFGVVCLAVRLSGCPSVTNLLGLYL